MSSTIVLSPVPLNLETSSLENKLTSVGGNPGNLVFMEALKYELDYEKEIDINYHNLREFSNRDVSAVMPSSNFIRHVKKDSFFKNHLDFFKKTNFPVTLAGLGAQSSNIFNTPKKLVKYGLNSEQVKFFKTISERAVSIGVRGEFTAECLELLGIHNYRIIGCPSFFRFLNGEFPDLPDPTAKNVQMTVTPGTRLKTKVLEFGIEKNNFWVMQSRNEMPQTKNAGSTMLLSQKWKYKNFPGMQKKASTFLDYAREKSYMFFDIQEWDNFYKEHEITFAFGTRFHGNMEAMLNGVPSLWITHDSRTRELTDMLKLPNIRLEEFRKLERIEEMFEFCDYSDTKKNYLKLCKNYVEFLNENNLDHKFFL